MKTTKERTRLMPHGVKLCNEYAAALGCFYDSTPKAVFAALAYSYATMFDPNGEGEATAPDEVISRLKREWSVLADNGIIPQRPPTK